MRAIFLRKIWMKKCLSAGHNLRRTLVIALCLGFLYLYIFLNIKISHGSDNYFEITAGNEIVKKKKVGILIACSYHENINSAPLTLIQLSVLCLPSIFKTVETRYEYNIYIGIESDIRSEFMNLNNTNALNVSLLLLPKAFYADSINVLAIHAFNQGLDYFVIIPFDAQLKWKYWTSRAIMSLKGHCPSDVGVVLQQCSENNIMSIVSRTHIQRFGYVYPPQLPFNQFAEWITSIYLPNYVSSFSSNQEHDCLGNKENKESVMLQKPSQPREEERRGSACVVSYSLYGSDKRYTDGAIENAELMKTIYPGWTMWVYHDSSVPPPLIQMLCEQNHIRCIDMTGSKIGNKMVWRFLVARSHNVAKYIIRDIDSRLSMREKMAVNEWIESGKRFHVMRDHPAHKYLINGGMWGGTGGSLRDLYVKLIQENPQSKYKSDMTFLDKFAWPIIKTSVLQHDSYYCEKYKGKPFLTPRNGWEHVGSVFIKNRPRDIDIELMKKYKPPKACQSDINIWEHL